MTARDHAERSGVATLGDPGFQGEQLTVTDASGQYRIPDLPVGPYSLRFEKGGFQAYTKSGIQLRPERTHRIQVELLPSGEEELFIHIGPCGPVVDLSSTGTGTTVGPDFLRSLPLRP